MLVFIDESGDTGRKFYKGSTPFFIVSFVVFKDTKQAVDCDKKIDRLRKTLKLAENYEFHFTKNSHNIRLKFLEILQSCEFVYFTTVIDKNSKKFLEAAELSNKNSFYQYACKIALDAALPYLNKADIVIDKSGSPDFRNKLVKYLRRWLRENTNKRRVIRKFKQQKSSSNNLLQAADYVSGVINRKTQNKPDAKVYYRFINQKEYRSLPRLPVGTP